MEEHKWPVLVGKYEVGNKQSSVAVVTLSSKMAFGKNVAMTGEMRTENLGIERVVINTISNPHIRYIILCGQEVQGHFSGDALVNFYNNGVDQKTKKIIGTRAPMPFIENLPERAIKRFQEQISLIDMRNVTEKEKIEEKIDECLHAGTKPFGEPMLVIAEKRVHKPTIPEHAGKDVMIADGLYYDPMSGLVE